MWGPLSNLLYLGIHAAICDCFGKLTLKFTINHLVLSGEFFSSFVLVYLIFVLAKLFLCSSLSMGFDLMAMTFVFYFWSLNTQWAEYTRHFKCHTCIRPRFGPLWSSSFNFPLAPTMVKMLNAILWSNANSNLSATICCCFLGGWWSGVHSFPLCLLFDWPIL